VATGIGIWLIHAGSSTYEAIRLNGHTVALASLRSTGAGLNTFQAGHSSGEIVGGSIVVAVALGAGTLLAYRRTRLAIAALVPMALGLGAWLVVAGNSTYAAVRLHGHLLPVASVNNSRAIGMHPFAAGRNATQILAGVALVSIAAAAAALGLPGRGRANRA
jgi:hypothetical protein